MNKQLIIAILLCMGIATISQAQQNSAARIILKVKGANEKEFHSYSLNSFDYYFTNESSILNDSSEVPMAINLVWPDLADNYIIDWVSNQEKTKSGSITITALTDQKVLRVLKFEKARVYTYSESFSANGNYGYMPQMTLMVEGLTIEPR